MQFLVCVMSTPLNFVILPSKCSGAVNCFPMFSMTVLHIVLFLHATAKSSTWRRNNTFFPSVALLCVLRSCVALWKPIDLRILLMCCSQSLGLSGCPWIACLTGSIQPSGIGSLPLCFVHQLQCYSSIFMCSGATGAGASANASLASAPSVITFSRAANEWKSRAAGCSTQLAHVWASVTAFPYCPPPLQAPRAFCLFPSLCGHVHTNGDIIMSMRSPFLLCHLGGGMGGPNMSCASVPIVPSLVVV